MDRITRLLGTADRSHRIIEIGPGYFPVAPKSSGWRTHVVDHAPQAELRQKYSTAGVDLGAIEEVDTIWQGGPLHEAVPASLLGKVDAIIASHVLEHIPDLIGFLESAGRLVAPDGFLSIALPDRRYCFDCLKPWTTTGDLLDARHRGSRRHSLKTAFNHMAYSAVVDGQLAWGPRPVTTPVLLDPFQAAARTLDSFRNEQDGAYADYHAWQFTPAGFRLAVLELGELRLSNWRVETLEGPENFEFFAVLRPGGRAAADPGQLQAERRDLLICQLREAREQIDFILGREDAAGPRPAETERIYQPLVEKLADQDNRLREMAETIAWLRALLSPVRTIVRTFRARR